MSVLNGILLVDDDETTNFLHTRLLNRLQVANHIAVANDGLEALQYLQAHCQVGSPGAGGTCPQLVLLDIKMPVMDGFEFLEQFEHLQEALNPDLQIMVLSSSVNFQDAQRLKEFSSVRRQFTKPLSEDIINQILTEFFPQ